MTLGKCQTFRRSCIEERRSRAVIKRGPFRQIGCETRKTGAVQEKLKPGAIARGASFARFPANAASRKLIATYFHDTAIVSYASHVKSGTQPALYPFLMQSSRYRANDFHQCRVVPIDFIRNGHPGQSYPFIIRRIEVGAAVHASRRVFQTLSGTRYPGPSLPNPAASMTLKILV
ncbi:protein of unknown function [Methylocella tundrae]|uniref:Uncharacterized protein n=1 Tax=Methylocella tundrae TaxID=227605 RepID=A0A4U8Z4K9_METTU|nr:protein of unknown function [Methylocella tundrae]